jgi:PAS domain S-box-containing protein
MNTNYGDGLIDKDQFMLHAVFNSAKDLMWMVDTDLMSIRVSRSFEAWTERETGAAIQAGDIIGTAVGLDLRPFWLSHHREAFENQHTTFQHRDANGAVYHVNLDVVKDPQGQIIGLIGVGREVEGEVYVQTDLNRPFNEPGSVLDCMPDIICTIDSHGLFMTINQAAETLLGYSPHELVGQSYLNWVCEDDRPGTLEIAKQVVTGVNVNNFENRFRHSNGSYVPMIWSASWHEQQQIMYCVARNASQHIQARESERADKVRFEKLVQEGSDLIAVLDESATYKYVSATSLSILGIGPEDFIGKCAFDFIHPDDLAISKTFFQKLQEQKTVKLPPFRFLTGEGDWRWVETVLTNLLDDPNVKGIAANSRDVTNRINAERELKSSEAKYRLLFDLNPLPMWIYDMETALILDVNSTAIADYGYSREEFLNMAITELRPHDERHLLLNIRQRLDLPDGIHRFGVFKHLKKDGKIISVEVSGHKYKYLVRNCMIVSCNDVTEREAILTDLKNKEEKLRTAVDIACLGYWQVDLERKNCYWSDDVYVIWGVNKNNFKLDDVTLLQTIHPDDREHYQASRLTLFGNDSKFDFEYRIILPDGSVKWIREIGHRNAKSGDYKMEGTVQDITLYKNLMFSLAKSNERFEYVSKATFDAVWDWDLTTGELYWGPGFEIIFGHTYTEHTPRIESWTSYLHPDDKVRVSERIHAAIVSREDYWKDEYRFKKTSGSYADVVDRGFIIRDGHGKALRIVGAMHDISIRKNNMRNLKLLEAVVTQATEAVLVAEVKGESPIPGISYINTAFTQMCGYKLPEIIGQSPFLLEGKASDKKELYKLRTAIDARRSIEITTLCYKKDGTTFWANFSCGPVRDEKGICTHLIFVYRDVSMNKQAEDRVRILMNDLYNRNKELRQFGYVVSHILRAPVASIMGLTNILELEHSDPQVVEDCTLKLRTVVNNLDQAIHDLNGILAITDATAAIIKENFDIKHLLAEVVADLGSELNYAGVCVSMPANSRFICSNRAYLYQIFYHLISNSIKYRSITAPKVTVTFRSHPGGIRIAVEDNGIGIDMTKYSKDIFKPYKRIEYLGEGKGLGLFLVKKYIEALKGKISVTSQPGEGTVFIVVLADLSS